jgi:formylglycine-generating enzyme required for sulfatase activity
MCFEASARLPGPDGGGKTDGAVKGDASVRRLFWWTLIALIVLAAIGCDAHIQIKGVVVDARGQPVEGADVRLFYGSEADCLSRVTTLDKGMYVVGRSYWSANTKPRLILRVERVGFRTYYETFDGSSDLYEGHRIVLAPGKKELTDRSQEHEEPPAPGRCKVELIWCPPGTFLMGSPETELGREKYGEEQVSVVLRKGFWIGKTEVTQLQWRQIMRTTPWRRKGDDSKERDDYPVTWVDYGDAASFCERLTNTERHIGSLADDQEYRLPTEAQWEYAARAGTSTRFSFGDGDSSLAEYAWFDRNTKDAKEPYAHRVRAKKPNPWGLHDVHGNVEEWCRDWYDNRLAGGIDPDGPARGSARLVRGGCWEYGARYCRSAQRLASDPDFRNGGRGFRVVRVQVK